MDTILDSQLADATLTSRVAGAIGEKIAARTYGTGQKLPSIRAMAMHMKISKSTVVDAYDRLVADGLIVARRGAGFFVAGHLPPLQLADIGPALDKAIDPLWISRQSLDAGENALRPGCGWMPPDWMPAEQLRRAMRTLAHIPDQGLTDYSPPAGIAPLRQLFARRLGDQGLQVTPDQIILTDSGTQAIDLVCRFLLEPGDTVLIDDPCYFNFQALLKAHRARIVSVPYTPKGPDPVLFAAAVNEHRPRLYITNSALHNPTGASLSPVIAHKILKAAEQSGMIIVEDDIFADFEFNAAPRLSVFDGLERVIHIGSLSKTMSAAARCGYVAVRPDWVNPLIDLKIAVSFSNSRISSELVLAMLKDKSWRKHLETLRARLAAARHQTAQKLDALGFEPWIEPEAGLFLWCRMPGGTDSADLAQKALRENIVLAPGNAFSHAQTAGGFMRFNVTQCGDDRLYVALKRLL
jgi:DNA-binding transcriptional MocR family regulator